jgi:hypothetical protein
LHLFAAWKVDHAMRRISPFQLLRSVFLTTTLVAAPLMEPTLALAVESDTGAQDNPNPDTNPDQDPGPVISPTPPTADSICRAIATAAAAYDLPITFFTNLIWQESRFNPAAVSRAGAQGVAQFMPSTARWRGLADPFDPSTAIDKSAELLRDLNRDFGNLGLAAAAYNAGPGRVRDWLIGRRPLPRETQAYVRIVTGRPAEEWIGGPKDFADFPTTNGAPCSETTASSDAAAAHAPPPPRTEPPKPWGVELAGGPTQAKAIAKYRELLVKYSAGPILADREPHVFLHGLIGEMGAVRVRIEVETRAEGIKLCTALTARGWFCDVLRNLDRRPTR